MSLEEDIQNANKANRIVLGYRRSKKYIRMNDAEMVVLAKNAPEKIKKQIEHDAKIAEIKVETFGGGSKELGVLCGKPYPVSVLVIK
jgi:large subunit ribosomal protein L30e